MAEKTKIKQGDAGYLGVSISINGELVTEEDLQLFHCIEFFVGEDIRRMWPDDVVFADGKFHVPYTQAETFRLDEDSTGEVDIRIHFETNGAPPQVKGLETFPKFKVARAKSDKELS